MVLDLGLGTGIRKKPIPDPGSRGQKGTGSGSATLVFRIRNTGVRRPYKMTNVELSIHCSIVKIDFSPNRFVNLGRIKSVLYVYGDLRKILLLILLLVNFYTSGHR